MLTLTMPQKRVRSVLKPVLKSKPVILNSNGKPTFLKHDEVRSFLHSTNSDKNKKFPHTLVQCVDIVKENTCAKF